MRPRRGPFEPPRRPEPQARINDAIRVPRVRLIDGGTDLGIKTTDEARTYAYGKGMARAMPYVIRSMVPACVSHDFHALATGKTSPVIEWLRALARSLHDECGGPGVGRAGWRGSCLWP